MIGSVSDRVNWHFNLRKFRPSEVNRVKISLACVFAFMAVGWPLIIYKVGILGWVKFWLMPWLGYHFWVNASLCSLSLSLFSFEKASEAIRFTHLLFLYRWARSRWFIIQLHTSLSSLRMSGTRLRHSLTELFIVIILVGTASPPC